MCTESQADPHTPQSPTAAQAGDLAEAQRIAIVRLSALGDVVNTLPALTALRRACPHAVIAWVCETVAAGVLEGHPLLDELIVLDRKAWTRSLKHPLQAPGVLGKLRRFASSLRARGFDAAIDFQGNLRSGVVTFSTRAPLRVGLARRHGKELSYLLVNRRVDLPDGPLHRVERGLSIVAALGIDTAQAAPVVPATDADRQRIGALLEASGLADAPFAVVHAGTSAFGSYKKWPAERWAEVAARLQRDAGLPTLLTHGPSPRETEEVEAIARGAGDGTTVAPLLSLRELAELFRRCRLFLSPDTGPMHLASAAGAPVVALFGPKDPRVYGPYFGPRAIVEKPLDCRPCRKRSCDDPRCMLTITPDDVTAAAAALIEQTTAGSAAPHPQS